MSLPKNPRFDLKLKRKRVLETGMILSLAFLIVAFKLFPEFEKAEAIKKDSQEVIRIENPNPPILPPKVPPPPKPKIAVEAPDDESIDDEELVDTGLDPNADVPDTPPPLDDDKNDEEEDIPPFEWVETMPAPIGGIEGIQKRISYPNLAVRIALEGRVVLKAYVDKQGNVYKVYILKSLGGGCDEAAVKAVMETKFTPGKQRGKPVKVMVAIPISFKLK